jgi:hypothetical protein
VLSFPSLKHAATRAALLTMIHWEQLIQQPRRLPLHPHLLHPWLLQFRLLLNLILLLSHRGLMCPRVFFIFPVLVYNNNYNSLVGERTGYIAFYKIQFDFAYILA